MPPKKKPKPASTAPSSTTVQLQTPVEIVKTRIYVEIQKIINVREHATNESDEFQITVKHMHNNLVIDQSDPELRKVTNKFQLDTPNNEVEINSKQYIEFDVTDMESIWNFFGNPILVSLYKNEPKQNAKRGATDVALGHRCIDTTVLLDKNDNEDNSVLVTTHLQPDQYTITTLKRKIEFTYRLYCDDNLISAHFKKSTCTLSLYVGSLFKLDPSYINGQNRYEIGFMFPDDEAFSKTLVFKSMTTCSFDEVPDIKRWNELPQMSARGSYAADSNYEPPENVQPDEMVVCFNFLSKNYLNEETIKILSDHIDKNFRVAIELRIINVYDAKKAEHYIGFINLEKWRNVGETKHQVQVEFMKFRPDLLLTNCGHEKSAFQVVMETKPKAIVKPTSGKGKHKKPIPEPEPVVDEFLTNDEGEMVLLHLELEMSKPFIKKQISVDDEFIDKITIPTSVPRNYLSKFEEQIEKIIEEFRKYFSNSLDYNDNQKMLVFEQLQGSGLMYDMKMYMQGNLRNLICDEFDLDYELFVKDKAYDITMVKGFIFLKRLCEKLIFQLQNRTVDIREQRIFQAREFQELNYLKQANHQYLLNLEEFNFSEETLIDYAIYNLSVFDFEKATEIIDSILKINYKSYLGILLKSYIMYKTQNYDKCEEILLELTNLHAGFLEGWITLFLFYVGIDSKKATDDLLKKIMKRQSTVQLDIYKRKEINWHSSVIRPYDFFTKTIVLFIKLGCYNYAELGISESILLDEGNNDFLFYLLAVIDYLKRDWENGIKHLDKTTVQFVPSFSSLNLAHVLLDVYRINYLRQLLMYNLGLYEECIPKLAEMFNKEFNQLIGLKLGEFYLNDENFCKAIEYFELCCEHSPTYLAYMGLGKTYYKCKNIKLATVCFAKASQLDSLAADPYVYLSLIYSNADKRKSEKFLICLRTAKRNVVYDEELLLKLDWLERKASLVDNLSTFSYPT